MAKLYFYYSAMNAGKSTMLLQSSYNYNERGMHTLLFAPDLDDRYGLNKIATRIGLEKNAIGFSPDFDLFSYVAKAKATDPKLRCVLVDEAQFLTKAQVLELCRISDELSIPVLAYGLRTDFKAEPFSGSMYLLALADELVEIKTVCHCGRKATMNLRVDAQGRAVREGEQVAIGGNELYVATCRHHFNLGETQ
ncbi:MAG TPA: thymidine kinase [Coxiellaceae bacterium]|nr:thymidine kinase [Coxiellaceae bacterium]